MTSYRKSTKVGTFTGNGFVEGLPVERKSTPTSNAGFYMFVVALAGAAVALINFFM